MDQTLLEVGICSLSFDDSDFWLLFLKFVAVVKDKEFEMYKEVNWEIQVIRIKAMQDLCIMYETREGYRTRVPGGKKACYFLKWNVVDSIFVDATCISAIGWSVKVVLVPLRLEAIY